MRRIQLLILCGWALLMPNYGSAQSASQTSTIPISKTPTSPIGSRPGGRAPAFQNVSCSYDGAALYITFVNGEGECELTLTDNASGIPSNYYFDSEAPACLMVGELLSASITITTEAGNTYVGEF
ncbi:MAG: hypothetical protein K2L21_10330 [Muribaculaceae bacterium]|nr:hypothetical protein [Muribaculaceae bacterium]